MSYDMNGSKHYTMKIAVLSCTNAEIVLTITKVYPMTD